MFEDITHVFDVNLRQRYNQMQSLHATRLILYFILVLLERVAIPIFRSIIKYHLKTALPHLHSHTMLPDAPEQLSYRVGHNVMPTHPLKEDPMLISHHIPQRIRMRRYHTGRHTDPRYVAVRPQRVSVCRRVSLKPLIINAY